MRELCLILFSVVLLVNQLKKNNVSVRQVQLNQLHVFDNVCPDLISYSFHGCTCLSSNISVLMCLMFTQVRIYL